MNRDGLSELLIDWYAVHKRDLPWREVDDPYLIWISEIILQQTRVAQGLDYYRRITEVYPSVVDLANAPLEKVLKLWQGLGYYSRARNMHSAAQYIRDHHKGVFPSSYQEIRLLKGVGDYTAAAIASFAFRLPYATVDGNVYRVLSRKFGLETPIDSTAGKKMFADLASELLHESKPDFHNQALMELGAICCTPQKPDCLHCPWSDSCKALAEGRQSELPVKKGKTKVKDQYLYYFDIRFSEGVWIRERSLSGVWKGLYEFPLVVSEQPLCWEELVSNEVYRDLFRGLDLKIICVESGYKHRLSHIAMSVDFYQIEVSEPLSDTIYKYVREDEVMSYPMSRLMHQYLERHL